ncbi:MAG: hypothetical protein QE271_00845 [Bacteriovoracaceae bacterium]|nr:hypothetical protein [Bacteriovoracaceae bacterium]
MNENIQKSQIEKEQELKKSRQTKLGWEDLRVAILTSDWELGQEISKVLRLYQVYGFYYAKLSELWQLLSSESIDLVIVDVRNLDDGELFLKNHPCFQGNKADNKTKIAFYFSPAHQSLLGAVSTLDSIGYINGELSLSHQCHPILKSVYALKELNQQLFDSQQENVVIRNRLTKRELELESFRRNVLRLQRATEVISKLQHNQVASPKDFVDILWKFFHQWRVIKNFSFMMLNSSGQRMVSPEILSDKYVELTSFWLEKACLTGIPQHVQQAAHELVLNHEDFSLNAITLKVCGQNDFPDILVFITATEDSQVVDSSPHATPQWMYLEQILSNHFRHSLLSYRQQSQNSADFQIPMWDALEMLEENSQMNLDGGQKCVNIDFSEWNKWIVRPSNHKIKYRSFWGDFVSQLKDSLTKECKVSCFGTWGILVFLPADSFEVNFQKCKALTSNFEYWRYLNDSQISVPMQIRPRVQILINDPKYYLKRCILDLMPLPDEAQDNKMSRERKMDLNAGPNNSSY